MSFAMALLLLPGLVVGLTMHEWAHAYAAWCLGDGYAKRMGRVSFNPFRHLSLLGTAALFVIGFGWAKPVPVNVYNFRHPKRDYLLSSLAGPAMNLLIVAVCVGLLHLIRHSFVFGFRPAVLLNLASDWIYLVMLINAILAVVNLLPLPPLDGSKIWPCLIPNMRIQSGRKFTWLSIAVLIAMIHLGAISPILGRAMRLIQSVTPTSDYTLYDDEVRAGFALLDPNDSSTAQAALGHFDRALAKARTPEAMFGQQACRVLLEQHGHDLETEQVDANACLDPELLRRSARILDIVVANSEDANSDQPEAP